MNPVISSFERYVADDLRLEFTLVANPEGEAQLRVNLINHIGRFPLSVAKATDFLRLLSIADTLHDTVLYRTRTRPVGFTEEEIESLFAEFDEERTE